MKTIDERARLGAWQIYEEIGLSEHPVDRVAEIIAEKILEQKTIDDTKWLKIKSSWEREAQINHNDEANYQQGFHDAIEKACEWFGTYLMEIGYPDDWMRDSPNMESGERRFIKVMEK